MSNEEADVGISYVCYKFELFNLQSCKVIQLFFKSFLYKTITFHPVECFCLGFNSLASLQSVSFQKMPISSQLI